MKKLKKIPEFNTQAEEKKFWESHDSADYLDWSKASFMQFVNLKPSTKTISLRLPEHLLSKVKAQANKADVPYQSYMKLLIADKLREVEDKYL